ncbi:DUF1364 family protein [Klebsiella pneumoniae]|uniref:DUF1364 family protein n=4 Tax=Enterobacterales TaxID=91347 RepID=A0A939NUB8_KLEPN|nr:DUF1364 family protein [Klebsiella pneumoniae]
MPMKHSWFHHLECTTQQADELVARYRQRGVKVERSLNPDFMTWTVSAQLVEDKNPPRPDSRWRNRMWGEYGEPSQSGPRSRMYSADHGYCNGNRKPACWRITAGGYVRHRMQARRYQAAIACNGCHDVIDGRTKTTDFTYDELRLMHAEGNAHPEIWRRGTHQIMKIYDITPIGKPR